MKYSVQFEPEALAVLENITPDIKKRIWNKIKWLTKNFDDIFHQSLSANLSNFYKLRIGDYRVIYELDTEEKIIYIIRIGHRRNIYDN
ncbi:MAG TPA: type II toxin-antitoxin system RelE/ParE family toxin [Allocoleopsis sp.]